MSYATGHNIPLRKQALELEKLGVSRNQSSLGSPLGMGVGVGRKRHLGKLYWDHRGQKCLQTIIWFILKSAAAEEVILKLGGKE